MIFSQHVADATKVKFEALLEQAGAAKKQEILSAMEQAAKTEAEDVMFAIRWI